MGVDKCNGRAGRPRKRWVASIVLVAKLAALAVVLYFVGREMVVRFQAVSWDKIKFVPGFLIPAFLFMAVVSAIGGINYRLLLTSLGSPVTYTNTVAINWVASLGKYVPGKVVSVAGAIYMLGRRNVRPPVAAAVVFLNTGLYVLVGLVAAAPLMLWGAIRAEVPLSWVWCVLLLIAGVVGLHPRVFFGIGNYLLRKTGREPIERRVGVKHLVLPFCLIVMSHILGGLSLWLVAWSTTSVGIGELPFFVFASAAANTLGFLAVFAPAGIGVKEGIFLIVLGPVIGPGVSAIVAVLVRFMQLGIDIAVAGVGLAVIRPSRGKKPSVD